MARSIALVPKLSFEALKFLLPTSIFFFRFLEWWYSSEGGYGRIRKKGGGTGGGKALRAPPPPSVGTGEVQSGVCVVHKGPMVNPTALPTGFMGCYKCLFAYVDEHVKCPVTGVAVEVAELRKIVG